MREIKFRVRDSGSKKIIGYERFNTSLNNGYLYLDIRTLKEDEDIGDCICQTEFSEPPMLEPDHPLSRLIREEYTGLKDKNGKEIYEGDLVRIPAKDKYEETTFNCFEVFYHDNECIGGQNIGFCINRMHPQGNSASGYGFKFTPESMKRFEVIGNIYSNPELIES